MFRDVHKHIHEMTYVHGQLMAALCEIETGSHLVSINRELVQWNIMQL